MTVKNYFEGACIAAIFAREYALRGLASEALVWRNRCLLLVAQGLRVAFLESIGGNRPQNADAN